MVTLLDADFFIRNRAELRRRHKGYLPIVIPANGLLQRSADTALPFTQDSNFWYLTGLDVPDAILVIERVDEFLIIPGRSKTRQTFDGQIDTLVVHSRSGIKTICHEKEGWEKLYAAVNKAKGVSMPFALPAFISAHGMHANPSRRKVAAKIKRAAPRTAFDDIRPILALMRARKQPEELRCIEAAVKITKDSLLALQENGQFIAMQHEYSVEAELTHAFRIAGATGHAYAPIVAAGQNATTLHYVANNGAITKKDMVVIDVGAEVEHYAADITRTLCRGVPTPRQLAVYDAVTAVQLALLHEFRPGAYVQAIEQRAEQLIGGALVDLGLITNPDDTTAVRRYYPHSCTHFLGLDVHDVGDYRAPLQTGMVLTCEPGIYIPEENLGVRIEDDLVITDAGSRVL